MNSKSSRYLTYFLGSSMSYIAFLLIIVAFPLIQNNYGDLGFSYLVVTFYGIPFVYITTLLAYVSYFVVRRFFPSWKLSVHVIVCALLFNVLFAYGLFEDSALSQLLVAIVGGAAAFLIGTKARKSVGTYLGIALPVLNLVGVLLAAYMMK
ncbi:hypothetical protein ACFFJY_02455 [Fictibacillus aquaticus]|uniref:Uncharacterized protein n=1 Tax=Fictibacillus aquaticus TaxID=2021314 RepID=A0A235F8D2_9BACL|nr:hypothetical protein [Fictibacillus aquaticus]OYD57566.1 hypothetical protein CGZ90_12925 [Fictibacillus aquaticus]